MEQVAIVYSRDKIEIQCFQLPLYAHMLMEAWMYIGEKFDFRYFYWLEQKIFRFTDERTRSYVICTVNEEEVDKFIEWLGWQ